MKWSIYNTLYFSNKHNCHLLYNSVSGLFIKVPENIYESLQSFARELINFNTLESSLEESVFNVLKEHKVFVNDDVISQSKLKMGITAHRYDTKKLYLTIAPTRDCNFACTYCYEKNRPEIYMKTNVLDGIIKFIRNKHVEKVNVCWYGGEPLLAKDIIKDLTQKIIDEIGAENYAAYLVTNGYLLDENFTLQLDNLHIKLIQITLDGDKSTHNHRRPHKANINSFDTIVENLKSISKHASNTHVSIRVNVDKKNLDEFASVYNIIQNIDNKFIPYIGFVQNESCQNECIHLDIEKVELYEDLFYRHGIYLDCFSPKLSFTACTARSLNSYLIDPEGDIYKCWLKIGQKEFAVGNIINEKDYITNIDLLSNYLKTGDNIDDFSCNNCKCFPICDGGCPSDRINNSLTNANKNVCSIFKTNLERMLDIKYAYLQQIQQIQQYQ